MTEPDELYTLRALYWLGHYSLCLEEAKTIARKPMPPHLKEERELFVVRAQLALKQYDKVMNEATGEDKGAGIQALALQAQYESPNSSPEEKASAVAMLQHFLTDQSMSVFTNNNSSSTHLVQLIAAQVFLSTGDMTREALQCVYLGTSMEHLSLLIQIYMKMDRLDIALETLELMRQADEESILTQLATARCKMVVGRSKILTVVHSLQSLTEQYGPSPMLLNMLASAYIVAEQLDTAEKLLVNAASLEEEMMTTTGISADTLVNMICCYQHQNKGMTVLKPLIDKMKIMYPDHSFVQGLLRVESAFEREALKYKVAA